MDEIERWIEIGKKLGYEGKELSSFVETERKESQRIAREERTLARELEAERREYEKEMVIHQIELEKSRSRGVGSDVKDSKVSHSKARTPKLPIFTEKDDLDSYLERFERFAKSQGWDESDWAINLSALLTGKALEVYTRMPAENANNFNELKDALLKRFQLTEEGFRLKFRESRAQKDESPQQYVSRLENYLMRWFKLAKTPHTFEGLKDLMIREQFLQSCSIDLSVFLKERSAETLTEMTELAEKYIEAHGSSLHSGRKGGRSLGKDTDRRQQSFTKKSEKTCFRCHQIGHVARDCRANLTNIDKSPEHRKDRRCFKCDKAGHIAKDCTATERKFGSGKAAGLKGKVELEKSEESETAGSCVFDVRGQIEECVKDGQLLLANGNSMTVVSGTCNSKRLVSRSHETMPVTQGMIGGRLVETLRDTGCSGIVVRKDLVRPDQFTGESMLCILMDGTAREYPQAEIEIDTPYFSGKVLALCMENPIYSLVVGNIEGAREPNDPKVDWRAEQEPLVEKCQAVETRRQVAKKQTLRQLKVLDQIGENVTVDEVRQAQLQDKSLKKLLAYAHEKCEPHKKGYNVYWYEIQGDLLYRIFRCERPGRGSQIKQLVIPETYRVNVMRLAHESLLGGHMGTKKTADRIMSCFHWPGIQGDISRFCRSCDICQRTIPKGRVCKVPLGQMPLIEEPFKRVAIDIVGPIAPMSDRKNRYILTIVDYATRYPEAVALPNIDAISVAEALVQVYSRVGIPQEVLSDLGTQFTSELMKEVSRLLSIKQLTTSPYHPACNGLVERYNGTLKLMLKRLCEEKPRDWDRYLHALLFAYREVPTESLGFSPFELLYGRSVRGPMEILKELWTGEARSEEVKLSYQYVVDLRNKIEETCKLAQEELARAQKRYKKYYDKRARVRRFRAGDWVLILLPTDSNKLLMQWKGPYKVVEVVSPHDYKVSVKGKEKIYHANLLKSYMFRGGNDTNRMTTALCASVVEYESESCSMQDEAKLELGEFEGKETFRDVVINKELEPDQYRQVEAIVEEFKDFFTDKPGRTSLVEHRIVTTTDQPVRSRPYPTPYFLRETIRNEVDQMLKLGVIEKSDSCYASPVVLVRKDDGSNRFCVDYRKLNRITVFDAEPMDRTEDIMFGLNQERFFSKIDLSKGYWQIPVADEDRKYTAFVTPDGLYQFVRMPFGLVNSGATFNRLMRRLLEKLDGVDNYVDDVLAHTPEWDGHIDKLRETFTRIRNAGLTVRPSKCFFRIHHNRVCWANSRRWLCKSKDSEDRSSEERSEAYNKEAGKIILGSCWILQSVYP